MGLLPNLPFGDFMRVQVPMILHMVCSYPSSMMDSPKEQRPAREPLRKLLALLFAAFAAAALDSIPQLLLLLLISSP